MLTIPDAHVDSRLDCSDDAVDVTGWAALRGDLGVTIVWGAEGLGGRMVERCCPGWSGLERLGAAHSAGK